MRTLAKVVSLVLLVAAAGSCATSNLARWGFDEDSVYAEPDGEVSRAFLKPPLTLVGMPVAVGWDVVTFPFQIVFGVHPYGSRFMDPERNADLGF
jgi:hypothetical protein